MQLGSCGFGFQISGRGGQRLGQDAESSGRLFDRLIEDSAGGGFVLGEITGKGDNGGCRDSIGQALQQRQFGGPEAHKAIHAQKIPFPDEVGCCFHSLPRPQQQAGPIGPILGLHPAAIHRVKPGQLDQLRGFTQVTHTTPELRGRNQVVGQFGEQAAQHTDEAGHSSQRPVVIQPGLIHQ